MSYGWCPTRGDYVHLDVPQLPVDDSLRYLDDDYTWPPETCWMCGAPEQPDTATLPCREPAQ